jgi:hypothetical protein
MEATQSAFGSCTLEAPSSQENHVGTCAGTRKIALVEMFEDLRVRFLILIAASRVLEVLALRREVKKRGVDSR